MAVVTFDTLPTYVHGIDMIFLLMTVGLKLKLNISSTGNRKDLISFNFIIFELYMLKLTLVFNQIVINQRLVYPDPCNLYQETSKHRSTIFHHIFTYRY